MINLALILHTLRRTRWLFLIAVLGVVLFEILLMNAMSTFAPELLKVFSGMRWFQRAFRIMVGIDLSGEVSMMSLAAFGFVHGVFLFATLGSLITACTGGLSGEVDTGTADLLLTLPVPRQAVYVAVSVVVLTGGVVFALATWLGITLGVRLCFDDGGVRLALLWIAAVNYVAFYLAIAGFSMLVSCSVDRRGRAVGLILAVLVLSFVLSFLEVFLPWTRPLALFSLFHYYRPIEAVTAQALPTRHLIVLCAVGVICWGAGLWRFCRRDIPAA